MSNIFRLILDQIPFEKACQPTPFKCKMQRGEAPSISEMGLSFLNNLRKIIDEGERIVIITLWIDITSNLINDRNNHRHHT